MRHSRMNPGCTSLMLLAKATEPNEELTILNLMYLNVQLSQALSVLHYRGQKTVHITSVSSYALSCRPSRSFRGPMG